MPTRLRARTHPPTRLRPPRPCAHARQPQYPRLCALLQDADLTRRQLLAEMAVLREEELWLAAHTKLVQGKLASTAAALQTAQCRDRPTPAAQRTVRQRSRVSPEVEEAVAVVADAAHALAHPRVQREMLRVAAERQQVVDNWMTDLEVLVCAARRGSRAAAAAAQPPSCVAALRRTCCGDESARTGQRSGRIWWRGCLRCRHALCSHARPAHERRSRGRSLRRRSRRHPTR